jgi:hypothetical protein
MRARVAVVAVLLAGCAPHFAGDRQGDRPETFALLLNGGGTPSVNYLSHAHHLMGMIEVLRARGLGRPRISVLSSDGPAVAADLAIGVPAQGPHAWLLEGTLLERPLGRPIRHVSFHLKDGEAQPARRENVDAWFADAAGGLRAKDTLFLFVTDHGEKG